ncbi:MAG: hypothetical protein GXO80_10920 [Chlorobi bacterium]|nr:hypothetical protein [Chlorobiota bacterium]
MILKKISLTLAALMLAIFVFAQDAENNDVINNSNELGLHAGFTTGIGLSFRHWSNKFGVQITAIPLKANDFKFVSAGLTGLYSLSNKKYTRFYLYLGNHLLINSSFDNWYSDQNTTKTRYNVGFGTGFEVGRKVRFTIMAGYGAYNLTEAPDYYLLPTIETGLYFKLK